MRIAITVPIWRRPNLARLAIESQREAAEAAGAEVEVVIVGSEGERSKAVADDIGGRYVEHANLPLGAKWNAALMAAEEFDPDWVWLMGSDDVVSPGLLYQFEPLLKAPEYDLDASDLIGFEDIYFFAGDCLWYWEGYRRELRDESIGAGRLISGRLCRAMAWRFMSEEGAACSRALDGYMMARIRESLPGYEELRLRVEDGDEFLIDVKDAHSVTGFDEYDPDRVWPQPDRAEHLLEPIREALRRDAAE